MTITVTGTLSPPVASPPGGVYQPGQTVTLTGPAGAEIRYTTDGTVPTSTSSAPSYNPKPNSSNWNTTPVVISFTCSDPAGVSSCPTSATFTNEGASQTVNVTATDAVGNVTNQTFTVNIDMTAPSAAISAPANASSTSDTSVAVSGTVSDSLSGVQSATCNGAAATVTSGSVACTVSLAKGENSVIVHTTDLAGNSRSASVRVTRTGTPTAIIVSPSSHTLLVGETRVLNTVDDFGQALTGVTWTSGDTGIATIDGAGQSTGVAAGQTTVTAAAGSLTTVVSIVVLSGTSLPVGTTRWSVNPFPGYVHASSVGIDGFDASVASVEVSYDGSGTALSTVVRAFDDTGRQTQAGAVPLATGEQVVKVMGSANGGVVLLVSPAPFTASAVYSLIGVGLSAEDPAPWRYSPVQGHRGRTGMAQASNGTIFAISGNAIVGINGATGARLFEVTTPVSTGQNVSANCPAYDRQWTGWADIATSIAVDTDNNANVLVIRKDATKNWGTMGCYQYPTTTMIDAEVTLYRVSPTGSPSVVDLHEYMNEANAMFPMPSDLKPLPDEQGGVLGLWQVCHHPGDYSNCETRARHVTGTTAATEYGLPYYSATLPSISASGRIAYYGGTNTVAFSMTDGTSVWSAALASTPAVAIAGERSKPGPAARGRC